MLLDDLSSSTFSTFNNDLHYLFVVSAFGLPAPEMKISRVTEESEIVFKPRVVTTGTTSTASFTLRNPEVYSETFNHSACIVFDQSMSIFNGQLTIGEFGAFTSFTLTII